jgi:hypothetical protein
MSGSWPDLRWMGYALLDAFADFVQRFSMLLTRAHGLAEDFFDALPESFSNYFPKATVGRVIFGTLPLCRPPSAC